MSISYKQRKKQIEGHKQMLDTLVKRNYDSSSPTPKEIEDFKILQLTVEEIRSICGNVRSLGIASKLLEMDEGVLKRICRYVNVLLEHTDKTPKEIYEEIKKVKAKTKLTDLPEELKEKVLGKVKGSMDFRLSLCKNINLMKLNMKELIQNENAVDLLKNNAILNEIKSIVEFMEKLHNYNNMVSHSLWGTLCYNPNVDELLELIEPHIEDIKHGMAGIFMYCTNVQFIKKCISNDEERAKTYFGELWVNENIYDILMDEQIKGFMEKNNIRYSWSLLSSTTDSKAIKHLISKKAKEEYKMYSSAGVTSAKDIDDFLMDNPPDDYREDGYLDWTTLTRNKNPNALDIVKRYIHFIDENQLMFNENREASRILTSKTAHKWQWFDMDKIGTRDIFMVLSQRLNNFSTKNLILILLESAGNKHAWRVISKVFLKLEEHMRKNDQDWTKQVWMRLCANPETNVIVDILSKPEYSNNLHYYSLCQNRNKLALDLLPKDQDARYIDIDEIAERVKANPEKDDTDMIVSIGEYVNALSRNPAIFCEEYV